MYLLPGLQEFVRRLLRGFEIRVDAGGDQLLADDVLMQPVEPEPFGQLAVRRVRREGRRRVDVRLLTQIMIESREALLPFVGDFLAKDAPDICRVDGRQRQENRTDAVKNAFFLDQSIPYVQKY